mmetsp:Transcript_16453/g.28520  ORF Transcript_16453/g.28520 Transcript_16453/m.28520 type:complete len:468 (+) Transcript_16453:218-1621(+)
MGRFCCRLDPKRVYQYILESLELTLRLGGYGLLGLWCILFYWLPELLVGEVVDPLKNETIYVETLEEQSTAVKAVESFLVGEVQMFCPIAIAFMLFVKQAAQKRALVILIFLASIMLYKVLVILAHPSLRMFYALVPYFGVCVAMRCTLPSDSRIPLQVLKQTLIIVTGLAFVFLLTEVHSDNSLRAVFFVVVFPITREIWYAIARGGARSLALDYEIGGTGVEIDRSVCWFFFLFVQLTIAMLVRVYMTSFDNSFVMGLIVFSQSMMEIVLRLTLEWRDQKWKSVRNWFWDSLHTSVNSRVTPGSSSVFRERRNTLVVAPSQVGRNSLLVLPSANCISTTLEDLHKSQKRMTSMFILGEMLAEYCAICLTPVITLMFYKDRLNWPLDYYLTLDDVFTSNTMDYSSLLTWTFVQLTSELFVDVFCCVVELYHGCDLLQVWKERGTGFFYRVLTCVYKFKCCCKCHTE